MADSRLIASTTPPVLRTQAMAIVQNFLADGALSDLMKGVEVLGGDDLVEAVASAVSVGIDLELRAAVRSACPQNLEFELTGQAFGVLVNLSWGNKELRSSLTNRPSLVESISQGLASSLFLNDCELSLISRTPSMMRSSTRRSRFCET